MSEQYATVVHTGTNNKNLKLTLLFIAIVIFVTATFLLPVKQWLISALQWTQGLGVWAPAFVVGFYIVATVLFLPGSILTLGSGFVFNVLRGVLAASVGSTLGACAAFFIGRTLARKWVASRIAGNKKFAAIDNAVGEHGFKIVFLIRLSPVFPFNFLNYAFGLTRVSFWKYALASWLGMIPGTLMYVYIGAGLRSLTEVAAGKPVNGMPTKILFWIGMAATVAVTIIVTKIARNSIRQIIPKNGQ